MLRTYAHETKVRGHIVQLAPNLIDETLSLDQLALLARFFRALGDPTRLQILVHLLEGEKNVGELVQLLETSQSRVSNHLACLRWCGLAATRRQGREIYYSVTDDRVAELTEISRAMIADNAEHVLSCTRL
jgi:DNA-binding transcriptional ArsR family regulator